MTWTQINAYDPVTLGYKLLWTTPPPGPATQDLCLPTIGPLFGPTVVGLPYTFAGQAYQTIHVQIDGLAGGDIITFTRALATGGTPYSEAAYDDLGGMYQAGIAASGIYYLKARGSIIIAKTGVSSTPTITLLASS